MTVKELAKQFKKLKRKYGDCDVRTPGDGTVEAVRLVIDQKDTIGNQWIEVYGPAMNALSKKARGEK